MVSLSERNFLLNLFPILREEFLTDVELFFRQQYGIVVLFPLLNLIIERGQDFRIPPVKPTSVTMGGGLVLLFVSSLTRVENFQSTDSPRDVGLNVGLDLVLSEHSVVFYL